MIEFLLGDYSKGGGGLKKQPSNAQDFDKASLSRRAISVLSV